MDDLWGNAWSAAESKEHIESPQKSTLDGPKWNTFERDADDSTVDVGVPSWTAASSVAWEEGPSNLWQAEALNLDTWQTNVPQKVEEQEEVEPEGEADEEQSEDGKDIAPQTILPTPPQSPLPLPSPPPAPRPAEIPPPSPPRVLTIPSSPDPFGSFESAEALDDEPVPPSSWTPKTPSFPPEVTDEPWGGAWGGKDDDNDEEKSEEGHAHKDAWELAQEAKRRRERKVPPELLGSLVAQWDEYAKEISPDVKTDDSASQSWRRGLDNVEGLADLVDSLLPVASFPPPVQFSRTGVAKAVKESLRLTRSFSLTRSSPMAHLYASKGSNDWERSVKAQKTAANDEWGWDLKHEPEEKSDSADASKEKKGGLLSFWGRRASSIPGTPAGDLIASNQPKSPTGANHPKSPLGTGNSKPASPATSARPSIDIAATSTPSPILSPTAVAAPPRAPSTAPTEATPSDGATVQPSAVSRFFNRFSRKPSATSVPSDKENSNSLALSDNDLSFLSDMVPSASEGSSLSHRGTDSVGSLDAMLSSPAPGNRYSSASSSKLPPPLAPPPPPSSRFAGPSSAVSQSSDSSFDAKMADAQMMDILTTMGASSSSGYAPVSFDLIDSSTDDHDRPASALPTPGRSSQIDLPPFPSDPPAPFAPSPLPRPYADVRRSSRIPTPILSPALPPLLPPPVASSSSPRPDTHSPVAGALASITPPPIPPPRASAHASRRSPTTIQRLENPLPPTPQRDVDDFSEFFSAPTSPASRSQPQDPPTGPSFLYPTTPNMLSATANQSLFTPTTGIDAASDFGDFGDFMSMPLRSPSPPKVPQKTSRAANHKPAIELMEKAAAHPGRWPAPPSPLPQPLAPPPGSGPGYFPQPPSMQQAQRDFLGSDSPAQLPPVSGVYPPTKLPPPLFAPPPSRPASTSFPSLSPPPRSTSSTPQPSAPLSSPFVAKTSAQAPAKSGLSAQDLSFFEGL